MPKVLNKRRDGIPQGAVYIGRPSKWGNPFPLNNAQSREDCLRKFERYLQDHPELVAAAKQELKGKDLVCFCAPALCHGDVWLRIANEVTTD
jgi:hypothetical protein